MTPGTVRSTHRSRVLACVVATRVAGVATHPFATTAWAHVTVHPETLATGSSDVELTFRVPNERDNAATVGLQVFFPTDLPLLTVDVLPVTGWTAKVAPRILAGPVTTDDGTVSQVVSDINWTAVAGGIAPGQDQDFVVAAGRGPGRPGSAVFRTLQTYSSGEVVRWIQVSSNSEPKPESPAPVLAISPASSSTTAVTYPTGDSTTAERLAIAALVLSLLAFGGIAVLIVRKRVPAGSAASAEPDDTSLSGGRRSTDATDGVAPAVPSRQKEHR